MKNNLYSKGISSIFIVVIIVVVIGGVGAYYLIQMRSSGEEAPKMAEEAEEAAEVVEEEEIPEDESTIDKAWRIYRQQSVAIESRSAEKFDSLFYFLSIAKRGTIQGQIQGCQERAGVSESECWEALKEAIIEWTEKADFVKTFTMAQEDSHQIVLIGGFQPVENGFQQKYLFFVKDPQNQEKVFILASGYTAYGSIPEEIQDSDNDGYRDKKETCLRSMAGCVKTNPNLKDTDGDGWWDSIEGEAGTNPNDANNHLF